MMSRFEGRVFETKGTTSYMGHKVRENIGGTERAYVGGLCVWSRVNKGIWSER